MPRPAPGPACAAHCARRAAAGQGRETGGADVGAGEGAERDGVEGHGVVGEAELERDRLPRREPRPHEDLKPLHAARPARRRPARPGAGVAGAGAAA